jgi:uncharacterized circularly permuted ATP-grasp superfamily protein
LRSLKQAEAEALFRRIGITFAVYGEGGDPDRLIPFDMFPRVFTGARMGKLERGIKQRARALNAFPGRCLWPRRDHPRRPHPARLVYQNEAYEKAVAGFVPPKGVYSHIVGIDIVRTGPDEFLCWKTTAARRQRRQLHAGKPRDHDADVPRALPRKPDRAGRRLFRKLRRTLASVAPPNARATRGGDPDAGPFQQRLLRTFLLADLMGVELVEGQDLFVDGEFVWMRTTEGPKRVDVIYRRIDDAFLDPLCFRPDSMLGMPGLMDVYRSGGVSHLFGPGAGVADDKAVYTYVPEMVRFYLGEEPILKNVPTWQCGKTDDLKYVLATCRTWW